MKQIKPQEITGCRVKCCVNPHTLTPAHHFCDYCFIEGHGMNECNDRQQIIYLYP